MSNVDAKENAKDVDAKENANDGETADAVFEALWARCEEAWDDDKPHAAILEHALKAQKLPELAGRYRKIKDGDEARSARAQKKIDGIVVAATQMLMAQKTPERTKVPLSWTLSFGLFVVIVVLWLGYKVIMRH